MALCLHDMADLDPSHHVFRHIKQSWLDGDFLDPAAFRLRTEHNGQLEEGLSVNWVEYFKKPTPKDAIPELRGVFEKKGRKLGGQSKFALLNVGAVKASAAVHSAITVVLDAEPDDLSHSLVKGYEAHNDQVAEEIAKVVIGTYPVKP